jgi:murein L,D-transpeptidase YcbB/YkuD
MAEGKRKIIINVPDTTLYLYQGEELIKKYRVTVGRIDTPTPIGKFQVTSKQINPTWYPTDGTKPVPPGENNELGTRWIGISKPHYGIHGTIKPQEIGKATSQGCIRLENKDVEELYSLIPLKTPVEIRYQTIKVKREGRVNKVTIYADVYNLGTNTMESVEEATGVEMVESFRSQVIKEVERKGVYTFSLEVGGE